jgi:hypothetical protein
LVYIEHYDEDPKINISLHSDHTSVNAICHTNAFSIQCSSTPTGELQCFSIFAKEKTKLMTPPGIYRHYKNKLYKVIGSATHSETMEQFVVYQPLYGEQKLWIRPEKMFHEQISVDGALVQRFQLTEEIA